MFSLGSTYFEDHLDLMDRRGRLDLMGSMAHNRNRLGPLNYIPSPHHDLQEYLRSLPDVEVAAAAKASAAAAAKAAATPVTAAKPAAAEEDEDAAKPAAGDEEEKTAKKEKKEVRMQHRRVVWFKCGLV